MAGNRKAKMLMRIVDMTLLGLTNFARFLARFIPPRVLVATTYYIGYAMYYIRPDSRECLLKNLREALPEVSDEEELKAIAKKAFSAALRSMLDVILMERHAERIDKGIEASTNVPQALDQVHKADSEGKGVIFFSPHLGGVTIMHALAARFGAPYTPMVWHPEHTPIPRSIGKLASIGQAAGCDPEDPVFYAGKGMGVIPKVQEHLRKGKRVGITFDLMGSTVMDFFGRPTAIASGIAQFACDSGAPILPGYLARQENPLDYKFYLYDPIPYELTGDRSTDVEAILKVIIKKGEEMIRLAPQDWIGWFGLRQWRERAERIMKEEN